VEYLLLLHKSVIINACFITTGPTSSWNNYVAVLVMLQNENALTFL